MDKQVYWMLELEVSSDRGAGLDALMREMVDATRDQEPGTLNYEWSLSKDGKVCHLYERYADSDAVMAHLGSFGANFAERFLAILKPTRFVVYGTPNDAVRGALASFAPVYMTGAAGFARQR